MKIILVVSLILFNISVTFSQKAIEIGGEKYIYQTLDSSKLELRGWWRVLHEEYYYPEDGTTNLKKWDKRSFHKRMYVSDSLFYFFTPSVCSFIEKPKYIFSKIKLCSLDETTRGVINPDITGKGTTVDIRKEDITSACSFFKKFPDDLLGFNLFELESFTKYSSASYTSFFFLNYNLLVWVDNGKVIYFERIRNKSEQYGWDIEDGYNIIKYTGNTSYIKINTFKDNYPQDSFLEIIYNPQKNCNDTWFDISTFPDYFTIGEGKSVYTNNKTPKINNVIKIPITELISNYIVIN
ncbi:hypothetical protein [Cellulophaga sp. BC115SP]|uniref:hypothetical protein n=1 Tax=Cellulophaga sp. BC115SP TaxID=2683263 RepID=UPI0014120537|nr:hypothetical protein [Cellulophaga sp. BC115SP]NBB31871.1 hypothetical protein [Cellulophaga sp. BC115SP]